MGTDRANTIFPLLIYVRDRKKLERITYHPTPCSVAGLPCARGTVVLRSLDEAWAGLRNTVEAASGCVLLAVGQIELVILNELKNIFLEKMR